MFTIQCFQALNIFSFTSVATCSFSFFGHEASLSTCLPAKKSHLKINVKEKK